MRATEKNNGGFFIGVTCPGCGANLELQSNFFVLECSHCGSILRVIMPETPPAYVVSGNMERREIRFRLDRYLKRQGLPLTRSGLSLKRLYYPYWKTDAVLLKVREKTEERAPSQASALTADVNASDLFGFGSILTTRLTRPASNELISERKIDVSLTPYTSTAAAGPVSDAIPHDIGLRAEYVRMTPFKRAGTSDGDEYAPVTISWAESLAAIRRSMTLHKMAYGGAKRLLQKQMFHPEGSIIYFPYYIVESGIGDAVMQFVIDGKSGRVVGRPPGDLLESCGKSPSGAVTEFGELAVSIHRCPTCGVDLPPTRSCVYICHNCHTVMSLDKDLVIEGSISVADGANASRDSMLPFWVLRLPETLVQSIAKSASVSSRPQALVIPAFRMTNFNVMRKLCQRITAAFPTIPCSPVETYVSNFRPVDIGLSEAISLAEICLYCEQVVDRPGSSPDDFSIVPSESGLAFVPFRPDNYFFVDAIRNSVTFARAAVSL